jgi:hypothetical protein
VSDTARSATHITRTHAVSDTSRWTGKVGGAVRRKRIRRGGGVALLALLCVSVGTATPPPAPGPQLTVWQQVQKRCRHLAREVMKPYPWPLAPFHRPHPVRGQFGDPRTVFTSEDEGSFSFHNGIDIAAWPGNHVYPVMSGTVVRETGDEVVVAALGGRRFQYIHLAPWVHLGDEVTASRTVLGTVRPRWNHVHLTELRDECTVNPLMPHHLTPYHDTTEPTVRAILLQTPSGLPVPASRVVGPIRIVADAFDTPELPSPYPWGHLPVAPVHVAWQLQTAAGQLVAHNTAADFRYGEPLRRQFCTVYSPGTEQNFAAIAGSFHWGKAGRYLFDLTPHLIDTSRLPEGSYRITVTATDSAGNWGTRSEPIELVHGRTLTAAGVADRRCAR